MQGLGIRTHTIGLAESVQSEARKINRRGIVIKVRASDFTQPLGRMSAKANEFTKSLEASNARVIAFGASAAIIGGVTTAFAQLVIQAAKVEKIMTDINVVLGATSQNLAKFGDGLFKVARNTSQSLETAAEAALEFSRQGLGMEETLRRTNDALILTRLTSMKAADAVKGLTAAVNGFGDAGLNTTQIINKLAAVDVKFAVGTDDLINALARAGAVAQDAGVSFDQLMGAVTAAQQITARGGAVIGNSFKTIFTRVQRSSTINRLEELGVAVRDLRGDALPAMTVLQNLSDAYDKLGGTAKSAIAEQVGGVFQINILKAAIKDLNKETSIYSRATQASATATNQAQMKNLELQKTLSSISAQTLTTVRELTANLGELTIAPVLKEFLSSANSILGSINGIFGEKEGESIGGDFAKGFARALGSVLTGPGMMITVLIFAKLFGQAFKFAKDSVKDLLQIASIKDKERMIQESIVDAMIKNVDLSKKLVDLDGNQAKQEAIVLELLKQQTAYLEQQRRIAKDIAPAMRMAGVQPNLIVDSSKSGRKTGSQGFIPNYNEASPLDEQKERAGARKGGYVAGAISTMNIPRMGEVVYNKNETVKRFSGMQQPAIMPPEKSEAGKTYQDKFSGVHGFDPYQGSKNNSTYSTGFIPNFAKQAGNTLHMDPAKLMLAASASKVSPAESKPEVAAALKDPKRLAYFQSPLDKIVGYNSKGQLNTEGRVTNPLSVLEHELGIKNIRRGFLMRKLLRPRGNPKNPAEAAERSIKNEVSQNQKHAAVPSGQRARQTGGKVPKNFGVQNFPTDIISYGASWPTIEVKSGEFDAHNIISKSLRMASDRELSNFIRKNTNRSDIADTLDQANFDSGAKLANKLNLHDPVTNSKANDRQFDISDPKDVDFMDSWGLSGGLIPNYVSQNARDAIMRLRKQGSTKGERRAADAALSRTRGKKTINIKRKDGTRAGMFEGMYIDGYIKGDKGLNKDLAYLIGKGYDSRTLQNARRQYQKDKKNTIISYSSGFIPNFLDDNKKREKEIFDSNEDGSKNQKYSSGFIPNFIGLTEPVRQKLGDMKNSIGKFVAGDISKEYPNLRFNLNGTLDGNYAYVLPNGKVFRPTKGQKLEGKAPSQYIAGKSMDSMKSSPKDTRARVSSLKNATQASTAQAIAFKTQPGHIYEEDVAKHTKSGWTGRSSAAIDFQNTSWLPSAPMGIGVGSFTKKWNDADAIKGLTHKAPLVASKLYRAGKINNKMIEDAALRTKVLDLTKLNFAEISGSASDDSSMESNRVYHPFHSSFSSGGPTKGYKRTPTAKGKWLRGNPKAKFKIKWNRDAYHPEYADASYGLIPNFLEDSKEREKEIFDSNEDGSKNQKYSKGLIPNFIRSGATSREFAKLSVALAKWSASNHPDPRLKLIGPDKLFTIPRRNADETNKTIQNIRQFISSMEYRALKAPELKKKITRFYNRTIARSSLDNPDRAFTKGDAEFEGRISASSGLIPNFSDPLEDALQREKNALHTQGSSAKVYVDQDNRLKNNLNPDGLMVANSRDEPISGSQGVSRAIRRGIDPKTHGAASVGYVPNFETKAQKRAASDSQFSASVGDLSKSADDASKNVDKHGKSSDKAGRTGMDMMGAMFALTSVTYALEGAMGDAESEAAKLTKTLNATIMGASQGAMVFSAMNDMGNAQIAKGTKMGSFLGKAAKGLGIFGAAIGVAIPIFNALKENTTALDTPMDTLSKAATKASKGLEALNNAIGVAEEIKKSENDLTELQNSSIKGTYDGRMKELQLQSKLMKKQQELAGSSSILAKELNLSGSEVRLMTSGTAEGMMALQEAQLKYQQVLLQNTNAQTIIDSLNKGMIFDSKDDENKKTMGVVQTAASLSMGGPEEAKKAQAMIESILAGSGNIIRDGKTKGVNGKRQRTKFTDEGKVIARGAAVDKSGGEQAAALFAGSLIDSLDGDTGEVKKILAMLVAEMKKNIPAIEEEAAERKINYDYLRETARLQRQLSDNVARQLKQATLNLDIQKKAQGLNMKSQEYQMKYTQQLGATTKAAEVQAKMVLESAKIDQDFANKKQEINNKYNEQGVKYIQSLFKDTKKAPMINPALTQSKSADGKDDIFDASKAGLTQKMGEVKTDSGKLLMEVDEEYKKLISEISKTAENEGRINYLLEKYLTNIESTNAAAEVLDNLQNAEIIPKQQELSAKFDDINKSKGQEEETARSMMAIEKAGLAVLRQTLNMQEGTLSYHQKRLKDLRGTPHHLLDKVLSEQFKTNKAIADFDYVNLRAKQQYVAHGQGLAEMQDEQVALERNRIIAEHTSISVQTERIEAERKLRQNMAEYNEIIAKKVSNEISTFGNKQEDDVTLLKEQKKQDFFQAETSFNDGQSIRDEERARIKHTEALNQGSYYLQSLHSMSEAARNFEKTMIELQSKLDTGEFAKEGSREKAINRVNMRGGVEKAMQQRSEYIAEGNTPRAAELNVEVQQQMKELNKELGRGSLFLDSWRVKLAEANERIANFSETLANTSFDAVRDGFRGIFEDIVSGTKSTGEIALNFFGGIAKKIQDKLFDQAADQLTAGMFQAFGLNQYHTGGFVGRYSQGGTTKEVPAMLTSGEYVVRKKIVDKIGINELNKINQTGSLEELYEKPNEENFELLNEGSIDHPPITRLREGGYLKNYLNPNEKSDTNLVQEDFRSSIDNLSNSIEKFAGGMVSLRYGQRPQDKPVNRDSAAYKIGSGAGMMAGTALGKMAFGKDQPDEGGPTAPKAPQSLNTRSRLNIDPTGRQMSARYRREDSYSKDYGKYLLDKYQYDVDKKNQKEMEKANQIGAIATTVAMMGGMAIGNKIMEGPAPTADDLDAKIKNDSKGFKKITRGDHNLNQHQRMARGQAERQSVLNNTYNKSESFAQYTNSKNSSIAGGFSKDYSYNNMTQAYYNKGGSVSSDVSHFNKGGQVFSPYSYFYQGGSASQNSKHSSHISRLTQQNNYNQSSKDDRFSVRSNDNLTSPERFNIFGKQYSNERGSQNMRHMPKMSDGGMVNGPGGIDQVGPVMLDRGEYVIKASSVNKVEKQYPGFFDKLNSVKMNQGGSVGDIAPKTGDTESNTSEDNSSNSNVTVNINVSSGGGTTVEGGGQSQQDFAYKIKDAVVGVIANEKRVGGMLSGN